MNRYIRRLWEKLSNPPKNENENENEEVILQEIRKEALRQLPVLWMLGKTGAGKSSIVRALTGLSDIEIGNAYEPCTNKASSFDFPDREQPTVRFLDTRGISEAGYDAAEDLAVCPKSHIILAVVKLDDPVQDILASTLRTIRKSSPKTNILVVHTGLHLVPDPEERQRALQHTQKQLEKATGRKSLPSVAVDFTTASGTQPARKDGIDELLDRLAELLPEAALALQKTEQKTEEEKTFAANRKRVLYHASLAGVADLAPAVGWGGVIIVQARMLHALGQQYGIQWKRADFLEMIGQLGMGTLMRYATSQIIRQAAKLVPGYGQTIGAVLASTASFAVTLALGRAASCYLFKKTKGQAPAPDELRRIYRETLRTGRQAKHG